MLIHKGLPVIDHFPLLHQILVVLTLSKHVRQKLVHVLIGCPIILCLGFDWPVVFLDRSSGWLRFYDEFRDG